MLFNKIYFFMILLFIHTGRLNSNILFFTNNFKINQKNYYSILKCKNILIYDEFMPTLYTNINIKNKSTRKNVYSLEHIYPSSYIDKLAKNDMHNIVKTSKNINNARSNYKYCDIIEYKYDIKTKEWYMENNIINMSKWIQLENDNYVNHKKKLFIPNNNSKGIISRAILYMKFKYNYSIEKIINIDTLIKWYIDYPPSNNEIYHNNIIKELQNEDNIFIKNYNNKRQINNLIKELYKK